MHTVRNRVASRPRPPSARNRAKTATSKAQQPRRKEPAFLLRSANPPAFPAHLILPPPRGAVISTMPWPEAPPRKRQAAPKKPRKVAKNRKTVAKGGSRKIAAKPAPTPPKATPPMTTLDLLDRALAVQPAAAADFRTAPKPLRTAPTVPEAPLPRAKAPAIVRNGGLIEAIGNWLRHTGTILTRWRARLRQTPADRLQLAQAAARQRALQSQFEALEALGETASLNRPS